MAKSQKVKVSERALLARINRKLQPGGEVMKRCRESSRAHDELGDYYLVNLRRGAVADKHIALEAYGRVMKLLQDYEELEGE